MTYLNIEPLVFIPGLKGSILKHIKSKKIHWLNARQALGLSSSHLKLPLVWRDFKQQSDDLYACSPIKRIALIPGLVESKIYQGLLQKSPQLYKNFYPFAYDWRRCNLETVTKYLHFLNELHQHYQQPINVIAHSMGGLITMVAMQRQPELFKNVFFVGVPFDGGVGFLEDLHVHVASGYKKKVLTPEVLSSMPSVFSMFSRTFNQDLSDGQKDIIMDFYHPEDWERLKIGPFAHSFSQRSEFKDHFAFVLRQAKLFQEEIHHGGLIQGGQRLKKQPELFVVLGKNRPTNIQFIQNGPDSVLGWDFKNGQKEDGDGRVSISRAYPPRGLEYRAYVTPAAHTQLLNDPGVLDWIFKHLKSC